MDTKEEPNSFTYNTPRMPALVDAVRPANANAAKHYGWTEGVKREMKTKQELKRVHGTPTEFENAIWLAYSDCTITMDEARKLSNQATRSR